MTNLRAILQERRQGFAADIDKAEGEMRAVQRAIGHLSAHIAEIDFVLVQLDTPSIPAPAVAAPPAKAPRELCADEIERHQAGVGAVSGGDPLDMPSFLRRAKAAAE